MLSVTTFCTFMRGPAGAAMLEFFDYCELHWTEVDRDKTKAELPVALPDTGYRDAPVKVEVRVANGRSIDWWSKSAPSHLVRQ